MKVKCSSILKWLLILSPIVDNINGYLLISKGGSNISSIFKAFIFLFCLIIIFFKGTHKSKNLEIISMPFIIVLQLLAFEIQYAGGFFYNISMLLKLLTPIVLATAVHVLEIYDQTTKICIDKISRFYCWFFPLSLIVPIIMGTGHATYRSGEGNKGFYYAGNEISIIMVMILALEIEKYKNIRSRANLLNIILGVVSILYLGTKTGYFSLVILILVALYSGKNINKNLVNIFLLVPIILGGLWYVVNNVDTVTQNVNAIVWRYKTSSHRGVSFLLSGRELRIKRAIELVYSEKPIRNILIGIGSYAAENKLKILIEMDLMDLLIRFGIIVFFVVVKFYVKNIKQLIKKKNIQYVTGALLVCGASVFAGHMLFSPMVSIVLITLFLKNDFYANDRNRKMKGAQDV